MLAEAAARPLSNGPTGMMEDRLPCITSTLAKSTSRHPDPQPGPPPKHKTDALMQPVRQSQVPPGADFSFNVRGT